MLPARVLECNTQQSFSPPVLRLKENLVALCNFSRREKLLFESHLEQKYPVGDKICRKFARNWHMMFRRPERILKRIYLFRVFNIRDRRVSMKKYSASISKNGIELRINSV